jgi:CBS domain-containing protein
MKNLHLVVVVCTLTACAHTELVPVPIPVPVPVTLDATDGSVVLSGKMEVPPVQTAAAGRALIVVNDDGTVSGVIEAPDLVDAIAVIEDDAAGDAGPVVITLVPLADGRWQVPAGTQLTPAQVEHYKSGQFHANVRTKAHPKGEVRGQLQSKTGAKAKDSTATTK